jgi:hypothetical protein
MGNSATPANSSLIRERLNGKILTAAECLEIADERRLKLGWFSPRGLHRPRRLKR